MKIFETSNYRRIYDACDQALNSRVKIICVAGERGQGRTMALIQYCKTHSDLCVYSNFNAHRNPVKFLKSIIKESLSNNEYDLALELVGVCQQEGRRLMVIDSFDPRLIDICIQIVESFCNVTLLISCTTSVLTALKRKKMSDPCVRKLLARIDSPGGLIVLDPPRKDEIREFCSEYGIYDSLEVDKVIRGKLQATPI